MLTFINIKYVCVSEHLIKYSENIVYIIIAGYSMRSQPRYIKMFSDFDEIFSVSRAFNSKHFDKKKILKSLCFHKNILKILLAKNIKNDVFYNFH
jgi:hypothetical protein